jgi:hypothetical protein
MCPEYNFKKFTRVGSKLSNYSISFNGKSYSFGFNGGFYTQENIASFKKVVLFFDEERKAVAFSFTNDEKAEGAFSLIHGSNKTSGSVTAKSFIVNSKICDDKYFGSKKPHKIQDVQNGQMFVVELLDEKSNPT